VGRRLEETSFLRDVLAHRARHIRQTRNPKNVESVGAMPEALRSGNDRAHATPQLHNVQISISSLLRSTIENTRNSVFAKQLDVTTARCSRQGTLHITCRDGVV
jgi:hypothetical protein